MTESPSPDGHAISSLDAFGDGSAHSLSAGGLARVDATTHRGLRNVGENDAIVLVTGGKNGYVGRDGQAVAGSGQRPPGAA